ncbi:50S ribosomal protein L9 [Campylobacter ureolyticus]|uniref:50S ribosomal protein L9 n=1 Tax=Campylobacter ureolyticus TaxID=827 RepID=UPI0022B5B861|nr:50S ribosomal protein L9 [Campylobacter ureolyticus]MCZ6173759.1 50S ribosomal protein L9 [Campylobacter ureolyticus]MCZ6186326.1 50S ribosomal protein L9 [Campylobacter ureolyticus]
MKVLLIKDVKSLGKAGEIKEVKDGYGHNFLVARGYAKIATNEVLRQYEAAKKREAQELEDQISNFKDLKKELAKIRVSIKKPVGEGGALFGSVTKDEVSNALKEQKNIEIDKKILEFDTIKHIGVFDAEAKFKHGITAKFEIEVVGE